MPFTRPALADLRARIRADFSARLPGADALLRQSNLRVIADVLAELSNLQFDYEEWLSRQLFPDTAETVFLDRWASIWGVDRKPATAAAGTIALTGTAGTVVAASAQWRRSDGVLYQNQQGLTLDAGGLGTASVVAVAEGSAGDAAAGTAVTIVTAIAGLVAAATVAAPGIAGGAEVETDEQLRARLLGRIQTPPMGGSADDYVEWALAVPGVTRAWCVPLLYGAGTVGVYFMMDDAAHAPNGIPTPADVALVQAALDQQRPVTAQVFALAPVPDTVDVTVQALTPDTPDIRAAANAELADVFFRNAEPGGTIFVSWLWEAVSLAAGERHHRILVPPGDVMSATGHLAVVGTVTYEP